MTSEVADREVEVALSTSLPSHTGCSARERSAWLFVPFGIAVLLSFDVTPDDGFITLRYAHNLLQGHGPVYNVGDRVEGFSSPLGLLTALPAVAVSSSHAMLVAKLISLLFGVLAVVQAGRLVSASGLPRWGQRVAFVLIGGSTVLPVSSVNGLETSLACLLVTTLALKLRSGDHIRSPFTTAAVAGGCLLARPDTVLLLGVAGLAALVTDRGAPTVRRLAWLLGPFLVAIASTAARLAYYGDVLPNTYYAKDVGLTYGVEHGLVYLLKAQQAPWVAISAPLVLFVLLQAVLVAAGAVRAVRGGGRQVFLPAVVGAQLVVILRVGGDWMSGGRFLAPVFPALVVLLVLGLVATTEALGRRTSRPRWLIPVAAGIAVVASLWPWVGQALQPPGVTTEVAPVWSLRQGLDNAAVARAGHYHVFSDRWAYSPEFVRCVPPGGVVAYGEAGFFGYSRPDLTVIDPRGLVDREIAKTSARPEKTRAGVINHSWAEPSSTVGRILLQRRPLMILDPELPPMPTALGGAYVQDRSMQFDGPYPVTAYRRADFTC